MKLSPPPVFSLSEPPRPLLEIGQLTQELLNIQANKCLARMNERKVENNENIYYVYSICIIMFFIIVFIILSLILIRYSFLFVRKIFVRSPITNYFYLKENSKFNSKISADKFTV